MVDMSNKPSMGSYSSSMSCTFGRDDARLFNGDLTGAGDDSSVSATSGTVKLLAFTDEIGEAVYFTGGTSIFGLV